MPRLSFLRIALCLLLGLLVATTAGAALFTVTLENGTTFETRQRPVSAEWDEDYAMLRTDQGNWIALRKDEIADVTTDSEAQGFGYQVDASTLFIGWTPGDFVDPDAEEGEDGQPAPPPDDAPIQYGGDSGRDDFGMDQFLDIPTGGGSIDTMSLGVTGSDN